MNQNSIITRLRNYFNSDILEIAEKSQKRITVTVNPGSILRICDWLYNEIGLRFVIASAVQTKRGFEIYYHFSHDNNGLVLNIHVILDSTKPEVESLSNMFNASNWIEREMHELFGINFINHPNQEKLISEGNWAEGVYPFRKEFR